MAVVTNFNDLKRMHERAVIGGSNSRHWIEFASTMIDSFPALFKTARAMNEELAALKTGAQLGDRVSDSKEWPHGATVKLHWWERSGGLGTIGWAKRGPNGELLSIFSGIPLDPSCWHVLEERDS